MEAGGSPIHILLDRWENEVQPQGWTDSNELSAQVAVDIVIFTIQEGALKVLLVRRRIPKFKDPLARAQLFQFVAARFES